MTSEAFTLLKSKVLSDLDNLDSRLTYHCRQHTEDVLFHTERIAVCENINDPRLLLLMKIAALFHDTGFVDRYAGHEARSCEILEDTLKGYEFETSEIELMKKMIMATKVPQSASTLHEKVLCDADLDYLGRDDFDVISKRLKKELLSFGFIRDADEWNDLQVNFISKHRYYTDSSLSLRESVKRGHLSKLMRNFKTDKP